MAKGRKTPTVSRARNGAQATAGTSKGSAAQAVAGITTAGGGLGSIRENIDSIDARMELGGVLLKTQEYSEAAECFAQVIAREPTHGPAHKNLAWCKKKLGDRAGAVDAYRQAVKYAPFVAETRRELGELLLEEGRKQEAGAELRQALRLQPDDKKAEELLLKASK